MAVRGFVEDRMLTRFLQALSLRGQLARSTLLATGWLGLRVAGQTAWVIALARSLGPEDYGQLAGIAGLAATLGTLTGLGFGLVMLQDASRNPEQFASRWKQSLVMTTVSGAALAVLFLLGAPLMFNGATPWSTFAWIAIAELVSFPLVVITSYAFQVNGRMGWAGAMYALIPVGNLLALGAFLLLGRTPDLDGYLPFHALMAAMTALVALGLVKKVLAPDAAPFSLNRRDAGEGAGFSLMRLVDTAFTSLDKTLVLLLAGSQVAGIYSAAYRLVSVFTLPIVSLSMSVLPRLFRNATDSPDRTPPLVRKLVVAVTGYGGMAAVAAWSASELLPVLLGQEFGEAAQAARWLALLPLIQGLYVVAANLLVASHLRSTRILVQAFGLIFLAGAAALFIPRFGLLGAVLMLLTTQIVLSAAMWLFAIASLNQGGDKGKGLGDAT